MSWRTGHGNGAGVPRIEVSPADELPDDFPAPPANAPKIERDASGRLIGSEAARLLGSRGGRAQRERRGLLSALGLAELADDHAFARYRRAGDGFVAEHLAELAKQAGGEVGPGPASIVCSAGMQLAASRFLFDRGAESGDAKMLGQASQLADASRQNLLAAYELAVREARARAKHEDDPLLVSPTPTGGAKR